MKKRKYSKKLSQNELKIGALVCFRNAEELLADSELLYSHKRFARAVFLSCIGTEELGKATLCLELYENNWQFDTNKKIKDFWEFWYHHLSKTAHGLGYIAFNAKLLDESAKDLLPKKYSAWEEFENNKKAFYAEFSSLTVSIKENSLYVDIIEPNQGKQSNFRLPSLGLNENYSSHLLQTFRDKVVEMRPRFTAAGTLNLPFYPEDELEIY